MNLYVRYFDDEVVVSSVEEAVDFLNSLKIPDFQTDEAFVKDLRDFVESPVTYPKRYKVRTHYYFIVIKTSAANLSEFKANNSKSLAEELSSIEDSPRKKMKGNLLGDDVPGWYDCSLNFKRVISIPGTGKFQYKDTMFRALVKADSPQDCHARIVEHLKSRSDVDLRSQFPSAKGHNFYFTYLGDQRPKDIESYLDENP